MNFVNVLFVYLLINAVITVFEQFVIIPRMFPELKKKYWVWINRHTVRHILFGLLFSIPAYIVAAIMVKFRSSRAIPYSREEGLETLEKILDKDLEKDETSQ